jgi:hypothetical protein
MNNEHTCGACSYWDHKKKRNFSNPDTPVYYSQCLYPVDELVLPHCVEFEATSAANGTNCPCFVPLAASA